MGKRILVVDDDWSIRWLLQQFLEDEGYEVDLATDGLEALEKLDHQQSIYDAILLDIAMPRMDGLQFLQAMQHSLAVVPSIIVLSQDAVDLQQPAYKGISGSLKKPFALDELLELIHRAVKSEKFSSRH